MSRLQVVSGKGGTGKTTVAAALALALATEGKRTLLVEVEGRQGIAQLFETEALPYEERKIAVSSGGGEVFALAIDAERALLDYLQMFYKLGSAGRALKKLGAIDFATTIAPGVRDVLLTGKACEAVRRRTKQGSYAYDYVVMDAPPTGRITRFLNVNDEVAGLAKFGPIHNQAHAVMRVLKSPGTAVHLVTLLEEMPVQETADGVAELRAADLPVGRVIVNMVRPHILDEEAVRHAADGRRPDIAKALAAAGVSGAARLVTPLLDQAADHARRVELEREQRSALSRLDLPSYELPLLSEGVDLAGLYRLARLLREQTADQIGERTGERSAGAGNAPGRGRNADAPSGETPGENSGDGSGDSSGERPDAPSSGRRSGRTTEHGTQGTGKQGHGKHTKQGTGS